MENYLGIYSDGTITKQAPVEAPEGVENENEDDPEENAATFEPFKDLCKRRFLWYYDSYIASIDIAEKNHKPGEAFKIMPFEGGGNTMAGKFEYPELRRRIVVIRQVLDQELSRWAEEGAMLVKRENTLGAFMQRQFGQLVEVYKRNDMVTLDLELIDDNPFSWIITYFGRPMTQLDGGMFRIRMAISPRWPEELPRVTFETKMFHHRIGNDGTMCYFPKRSGDLQSHVDAIIEALEEEHPPYDPRTLVNIEASKLFWGSESDKKQYNRQLRRSVQRSMEE